MSDSEKNILTKDHQSNKYQLTLNNPDKYGYTNEKIHEMLHDNFKTLEYICLARERASTGTEHYHVFVYFGSKVRFSTLKRYFPEAHIELCRGTVSQNVAYVEKGGKWEDSEKGETRIEGTFQEWGKRPPDSKGKKTDMTELYRMVLDGMSNTEIYSVNQDYIRDGALINNLRLEILREKNKDKLRDVHVTYVFGKTGSGKTWGVYKRHSCSDVCRVTGYKHPFDGYNGQKVLVLEEFRDSIPLESMLSYLDIYPVELEARYSNRYACYTEVYIISNWTLEEQYKNAQKFDKSSWEAFLRRINKILYYRGENDVVEYNSVNEYFNRESGWTAKEELPTNEQMELPFS